MLSSPCIVVIFADFFFSIYLIYIFKTMTKKSLNAGFMHSLKNDEFPQLYGNVCSVLEGEEITLLHIKESFERVKTHLEPLKFVKNFNGSHPLSEVLMINAKLRKDHLLSLQMGIKAKLLSEKTEEREAAKELIKWLGKYRGILYYPGIESQSRW